MDKLKSRKFWVALIAMILVAFSEQMGLDLEADQILGLVSMAAAYVLGEGYADGQAAKALGAG